MTPMTRPPNSTAQGLAPPRVAAITAGSPKIPLPIMVFTTRATKLQRPIARINCGCDVIQSSISYRTPHDPDR